MKKNGLPIGKRINRSIVASMVWVGIAGALSTSATLAWFSLQRDVGGRTEMQFDGEMILSERFEAFKYIEKDESVKKVTGSDITVPTYDSVFTERNSDSVLIYKVPVFGPGVINGNAFTITLSLKDCSSVTGKSDNNYLDGVKTENDKENAVADYISNIAYFQCSVIAETTLNAETLNMQTFDGDEDTLYQAVHAYFQANVASKPRQTFVTLNGENPTKVDHLTFAVSDYASALGANEILYVYIEVGYDETLVRNMIETREMSILFDDEENKVVIPSDLQDFIFELAPLS